MIFNILQTIGTLLSGFSIFTAFILYKKEKRDLQIKEIKESIANVRTILEEQYYILQTNYIYTYIEEYISNKYIETFIADLANYIEKNLNKPLEEVKEYADQLMKTLNVMEYIPIHNSNMYSDFKKNNQYITRHVIYNLKEIVEITKLLEVFQCESITIHNTITDKLSDSSTNIDIICNVLVKNKIYLNNQNVIKQRLQKKYFEVLKEQYKRRIDALGSVYNICDLILEKFFELDDKALYKYVNEGKVEIKKDKLSLKENLYNIINKLPKDFITSEERLKCGEWIGKIVAEDIK